MGIELLFLAPDGVMFDTEDAHLRACNAAFQACGIDLYWNLADFRAAAARCGAALAASGAQGVSPRDMKAVLREKQDAFHALVLDRAIGVNGECLSLAQDALAAGCKLAVVTDLPARTITALLEQAWGHAVNDVFSVVAGGADLRHAPGSGPYRMALVTVGVEAEHAAAIETSASAIEAAEAAGIWTFAASMQGRPRLRELGDAGDSGNTEEGRPQPEQASKAQIRAPRMIGFDMLCMLKQQQQQQQQQQGQGQGQQQGQARQQLQAQHRRDGMPARRSA